MKLISNRYSQVAPVQSQHTPATGQDDEIEKNKMELN